MKSLDQCLTAISLYIQDLSIKQIEKARQKFEHYDMVSHCGVYL